MPISLLKFRRRTSFARSLVPRLEGYENSSRPFFFLFFLLFLFFLARSRFSHPVCVRLVFFWPVSLGSLASSGEEREGISLFKDQSLRHSVFVCAHQNMPFCLFSYDCAVGFQKNASGGCGKVFGCDFQRPYLTSKVGRPTGKWWDAVVVLGSGRLQSDESTKHSKNSGKVVAHSMSWCRFRCTIISCTLFIVLSRRLVSVALV